MDNPHNSGQQKPSSGQDLTGRTLGRFHVQSRLGEGGMGEVYLAEDTRLKRLVALKRMAPQLRGDPRLTERFRREVELASRISHPHIAAVYDVFEFEGESFLVMEYVEGQTLRSRFRGDPIPVDEFLEIARQCSSALAVAHEHGVLHRDLKPENILITRDGQVKILDFGLAKALPRSTDSTLALTEPGLKGTPGYMAPEALLEKEVDARADLFSLGVVFYEMLAGRHPFMLRGDSFITTVNRVLKTTPKSIGALNSRATPQIEAIVMRLLEKEPVARYMSAAQLGADLKAAAGGSAVSALTASSVRLPFRYRKPVLGSIAVMLVVAAAAGLYLYRKATLPERRGEAGVAEPPGQTVRSIAILPFRNIGPSGKYDYFGVGLADVLTAKLANTPFLEVRWVGSMGNSAASQPSPVDAGQRLGVDAVLSGSYQIEGSTLELNYILVDVRRNAGVAGSALTMPFTRAIDAEDQLASDILTALKVSASPQERAHFTEPPSHQADAFQAFLRSEYEMDQFWKKPDADQLARVEKELREALRLDPHLTLALVSLAKLHWTAAFEGYTRSPEDFRNAEAEANMAIQQDPSLGEAYAARALVELQQGRIDKARASLQEAFGRSPHDALAFYAAGFYYMASGLSDLSLRAFQQARILRPQLVRRELGYAYRYEGNLAKAEEQMRLDLSTHPDDLVTKQSLTTVLLDRGDIAAGRQNVMALLKQAPNSAETQYLVALLKTRSGEALPVKAWLDRYRSDYWPDLGYCVNVAEVLALAHQNSEALRWLQRAEQLGLRNYPFLAKNPLYDNLRADPAFRSFLASVQKQWEQARQRERKDPLMPAAG
ncbi:MAG: protein kinase [Acidobacteriota bacterium]|nr:protein kinase [Acidobacteriota bacterium]